MLFDNIDTVVTLLWTMDRICICIFLFFGVAIVLFLCFSTVIGELKITRIILSEKPRLIMKNWG